MFCVYIWAVSTAPAKTKHSFTVINRRNLIDDIRFAEFRPERSYLFVCLDVFNNIVGTRVLFFYFLDRKLACFPLFS